MAETPSLFEDFSYTGLWWLPDQKGTKWAGTLSFKPEEGARLDLIVESENEWLTLDKHLPRLQGIVIVEETTGSARNIFTLLNCQSRGYRSQSEIIKYSFRVGFVLRGLWYSLSETVNFMSASISFSSLAGWMPYVASITSEYKQDDDLGLSRLDATYLETPPVEIKLAAINAKLLLSTVVEGSSSSRDIDWSQSRFIRIVPETKQSLDWFMDQICCVRDLLALLSGLPVETKAFEAVVSADDIDGLNLDLPLQIYHSVRPPKVDDETGLMMPFPLARLGINAQKVFQTWIEICEDEKIPFKLCLDVLNNSHQFWQFEFLALIQALENHHRLYFEKEGQKIAKYKHENGKVKRKGPDLIDRLKELRENLSTNLPESKSLSDEFLNSVRDTRNYYTHYNSKDREKAFKDLELYDAIARLIPFIAYFLYQTLVIPEKVICEAFKKTRYRGLWQRPRLDSQEAKQVDEQEHPAAN